MYRSKRFMAILLVSIAVQQCHLAFAEHTIAMFRISEARGIECEHRETEVQYDRYVQTQLVLLQSPAVLNAALDAIATDSPEAAGDWDLATLTRALHVERVEESEIVRATLAESDESSLVVLNAVVDAYLDYLRTTETGSGAPAPVCADEVTILDESIREQREMINDLAAEIGSADPDVARLRVQMAADQLRTLSQKRSMRRDVAANVTEPVANDEAIAQLLERDRLYAESLQQIAAIGQAARITSGSDVGSYQNELDLAKRALQRRKEELIPLLQHQLAAEQRSDVEQAYQKQLDHVKSLSGLSIDLAARRQALHDLVASRKTVSTMRMRTGTPPLRVTCIQRAISLNW